MKPETLAKLRDQITTISDPSLAQFFAVVLDEMQRRRGVLRPPPKSPPRGEFKVCEPIRGY